MTIQHFIDLYRAAAQTTNSDHLRNTYTQTAQVLEAQSKAFNQLYELVKLTCEDGDLAALRDLVVGSFEFPSFCWCFGMIKEIAESAK